MSFVDSPHSHGEKVSAVLRVLGDSENRQFLYIKLVFLIESLKPLNGILNQLSQWYIVCIIS